MALSTLITPANIVPSLRATSKKQALQELAALAEKTCNIPARVIFDRLIEREKLGTTGVGHGVAIPHARLDEIDQIYGLFARLAKPVDFDSVDDEPVDIVFLLLAPCSAGTEHLKTLASISRLLRCKDRCAKLRGAQDAAALFVLICEESVNRSLSKAS